MEGEQDHRAGKTLDEREPVFVPSSRVSVKTAATVTAVVLGMAALAWILVHSPVAITLTVLSALLAIAVNHGVDRLQVWGVRRGLAVLIVMLLLLAIAAGLLVIVIPSAVSQVQDLSQRWPQFRDQIRGSQVFIWLDQHFALQHQLEQLRARKLLQQGAQPALKVLGGVFEGVVGGLTILFLLIFMLLYAGPLVRGVLAETLPAHRERYERVLGKLYRSIGGYISGLCGIALLNATLMAVFLAITRVPFFLPLGILSGVGSFIPLIGATASGALIVIIALATQGPWAGFAAAAYIIVYQQFENHVVGPLIYKRTVQVNPLITILGFLFLAELAGVVGAFLTVPIITTAQIVIRELFILRRERLGLPSGGEVAPSRRRRPFWRKPRHA